jgi:hypothetical protein
MLLRVTQLRDGLGQRSETNDKPHLTGGKIVGDS